MHPDARELTIAGALALRDLILVMRKDEVDATRMEIDRRLARAASAIAEHSICQPGRPGPVRSPTTARLDAPLSRARSRADCL